jgi:hypothetical protein
MVTVDHLEDGTRVLISDERFETLHLTKDGKNKPTKFALVLTPEIELAIKQDPYNLSA